MKKQLIVLVIFTLLVSCDQKEEPIVITANNYHNSVDKVSEIMVHDIFSPPVASRIFAYPNIAAYEIIAQQNDAYLPLEGQITDLTAIPRADASKPINYQLAALIAHIDLSRRLIFSEDRIVIYRDSLYQNWQTKNADEFKVSKNYGLKVADHIAAWMDKDNYKQTRTMPKFTVNSGDPSRWQPTPPSYMDGIEPHWDKIRPFVINSSAQFKPVPPPAFSMKEDSDFYKELKEVYDISMDITKKGDESEEIEIAQFWDCNPYVSVTRGHLMFATKKITPGAHWIGITKIACKKTNSDFDRTVYAYTKTSIAIADAFISCWDEKYRSNLVRPETLINQHIDENWKPVLQTPPFPEYVSGHSVASGAAAIALTDIFGDNFAFEDDTELIYGLPIRSFTSFNQAADEAAISRMYGGIHYRAAVEIGVKQGRDLGNFVVDKIKDAIAIKLVDFMKKKISLFILLIVFGTLIWYLFIKPYDYLVTFKVNTFPGTINQTIKLWSKIIDPNSKITQNELQNISQELTIKDTTYYYKWKIQPLTDSTSKVKVYVKDVDHSLINKIKIPFSETDFEKTTKRTLLDFNEKLTEHLKKFKVKIIGKDTFKGAYCAYVPIKSTQLQKAKGMKQNYLFLSDFVASNKIELNGTPMAEITKWDITTDSIHYNFCFPIIKSDSLPVHNLIKYKQLIIKPSLKAIYNGNYITSDRGWYSLLDYADKRKIEIIPKPIEVYNNNPNMGGDELKWKTEVYMPISQN